MQRRRDDQRAEFEALAMPLLPPLHALALRLTRHDEDAADLVQETFLRAYRTFGNFRPGTNARAWLFTIMYSIHANARKRKRRRPTTVPLEGAADAGPLEIPDLSGTEAILSNPAIRWRASEVDRALSGLRDEFRQAVLLVDVGELTYEEAAAAADCPVGTIRSRLSRARRLLAHSLRDEARARGLAKE